MTIPDAPNDAAFRRESAFWAAWLAETMTEPMTLADLADWFNVDRSNVSAVLAGIDGLERVAVGASTRYRVPVGRMPAAYTSRLCPFPRTHPHASAGDAG